LSLAHRAASPWGPGVDPLLDRRDLARIELALRRHVHVDIRVEQLGEKTLLGLPRHDRRIGIAALDEGLARVDEEPALPLRFGVAVDTLLPQDRERIRRFLGHHRQGESEEKEEAMT
jgi:hypothetical protein